MNQLAPIHSDTRDHGRKVMVMRVDSITVGDRLRTVREDGVALIAASMAQIGLRTPISVRVIDDGRDILLLTGANRLAAAKKLGWENIECIVQFDADETEAELWEIAENLHRADLSEMERAQQIERWRQLTLEKVRNISAPAGGKQPVDKGYRKTAAQLGVSEKTVRNAEKIASLPAEVRQIARDVGLDDNQTAMLAAAKLRTPNEQADELQRRKQLQEEVLEAARLGMKPAKRAPKAKNPLYQEPTPADAAWTHIYGVCRALSEWATSQNLALAARGRRERSDDQSRNIEAIRRAQRSLGQLEGLLNVD